MMQTRVFLFGLVFLTFVGCSSTPEGSDATAEGGDEAAAEGSETATDEGLSDEPMNEGGDVASEDLGGEGGAPAEKSLFDRVGGKATLEQFSSNFIDSLIAHPDLQKNPALAKALLANQAHHKQMLAEFFCAKSGGPCSYTGKAMKDAHASFKITRDEWNIMRKIFVRTLRQLKVPKKERMDLALIAGRQKKMIVQ